MDEYEMKSNLASPLIENDIITTNRLMMRKFTSEDVEEFSEIANKDEVGQWLGLGRGMSFTEAEEYMSKMIAHWNSHHFGVWAITDKSNKEIIGHCGLRYIDDSEDIEIIYLLDPKHWGQGFATEAGSAAVQYAFHSLRVKKLLARVRKNNRKSKNVINKLGFKFTGDREYNGRVLSYYELTK